MNRTKQLVTLGALLGLEVVLSRFFSISTPIVKIGFAFIPISIAALLFGPLWAGATAALADFLGATLFPIGPYFPGFTLTAFLTGVLFGILLYRKPPSWRRALAASLLVTIFLTLLLDMLWLSMLYNRAASALIVSRLIKCAVMLPLQTIVISTLSFRIRAWLEGAGSGSSVQRL